MDSGGQLAILAILFKLSCECSSYSPPKDSMPLHIKSLKYVLLNTTIVPLGGVQEKKKKKLWVCTKILLQLSSQY